MQRAKMYRLHSPTPHYRLKNGFIYKSKEYPLSLKGTYQPQNAAVVLEITSALNKQGFNVSDKDISYGLSHTSWAARFEFVSDRVVIDGGHNIDGIKALKNRFYH